MSFYKLFSMLMVSIVIFSGCGTDDFQPSAEEEVQVDLLTAEVSGFSPAITISARIESKNQANASTIVMGNVTDVPVSVGQAVRKGDVLIRIKDDQIRAKKMQLEANRVQARANLENTEKNLNRIQNLFEDESATTKELDDITTMYEIAKANLEALEASMREVEEMLSYSVVRAPFDGIVSRKFVDIGDMATPGHPLVAVSDPNQLKVTASVPESIINRIENSTEAAVSVPAAGIDHMEIMLTAVSHAGDPASRQFAIEADIPSSAELKPGMFATIQLLLPGEASLNIPVSALVQRGQLTGIFTKSDQNRAILRWVKTGKERNGRIEILSGLQSGEQFVANPSQKLQQGQSLATQ